MTKEQKEIVKKLKEKLEKCSTSAFLEAVCKWHSEEQLYENLIESIEGFLENNRGYIDEVQCLIDCIDSIDGNFEEGKETLCGNCGRIATHKVGDIHRCDRCFSMM